VNRRKNILGYLQILMVIQCQQAIFLVFTVKSETLVNATYHSSW